MLAPITSELLTYALLQNTTTLAAATSQLTYVSQGNYRYTFQQGTTSTFTQLTTTTNVTPLSAKTAMPLVTEPPVPSAQPDPTESAPSLPGKTKRDDTVFLTPLPMVTYTKPPTSTTQNYPQLKPSNPNQNLLIKALLAQKSTLSPYMARPPAPMPATRTTTSFIIRASTKSPSGKTQIVNLPVSVSTPVSIVRNAAQGSVRPTITKNLVEKMAQRPVARSAFVKTTTGTEFAARNPPLVTVMTSHATTTMAITTPMTITPRVSYSPSVATTGAGAIVTTTVSIATAKPIMIISTAAQKTRTTCFPTYTKTYIPVLPPPPRKPKAAAANKTHKPSCPSPCLTAPSSVVLAPRCPAASSPSLATVAQRPPARARTNLIPGHANRYLEPGEILQVRKIPHRTFSGPRSVPAVVEERAQLKASKHAENHAESQATLQASQVHYDTTRAMLHATSLVALQDASHARLEASQARDLTNNQQAKNRVASQIKVPATSQSHFQVASLGKIQTVSLTQPQGILNVQLLNAAQSQLLATSQAQLQAISRAQLNAPSQGQLSITSQAQHHATPQSQLKTSSQAQLESQADSAQPSARTHHRLIIRSVTPTVPVPTPHSVADAAVAGPPSQGEQLLITSVQESTDAASCSIHTTTTLTLSTGTTLIMPHYKTTVFKNLSTIANAEPSRLPTPTTVAGAAERVVIRRPVAYFSARRSFPTQSSGTSTSVNVQRHIIRTIPRHVLGSHLQLTNAQAPPVPRMPQVVSTSSSDLTGSTTLSQNKPQSADKKK